jgi:hypothetical protein
MTWCHRSAGMPSGAALRAACSAQTAAGVPRVRVPKKSKITARIAIAG